MKGDRNVGVIMTVMMVIIALAIIVPPALIVAIPFLVVFIIIKVIDSKKKKEEAQKQEQEYLEAKKNLDYTMSYLWTLDRMSEEEFKNSTRKLIHKANSEGYKLKGYITSGEQDVSMMYYQSVDNVGIAPVRNIYGNKLLLNSVFVTNRYLTPKAKEFCKSGMIIVIDRDVLSDICIFMIEKGFNLETLEKSVVTDNEKMS